MRRQRLTARSSERFKNYGSVLQRHEQGMRMKKIVKVFGFFLMIAILILIYMFIHRWEQKKIKKEKTTFVTEQKISPHR
jgi:Na+/H+ antiporter NhaC